MGFLYLFAQGEANNVFLASEEVVDQQNVRYPSFLPFFIHFIIPSPFLVSLSEIFFFKYGMRTSSRTPQVRRLLPQNHKKHFPVGRAMSPNQAPKTGPWTISTTWGNINRFKTNKSTQSTTLRSDNLLLLWEVVPGLYPSSRSTGASKLLQTIAKIGKD